MKVLQLLWVGLDAFWHSVGQLLLGIFVGAFISQRWQRRQWLLDNKKTEYRELLSGIATASYRNLKALPLRNEHTGERRELSPDEQGELLEAQTEGQRLLSDRIFIASQIERENIIERWQLLTAEEDFSMFVAGMKSLHEKLLEIARKDLGIKS